MLLLVAPLVVLGLTSGLAKPAVVAVPFGKNDAHAPALTEAVDGALYAAASAHGLRAARVDSVFGVKEELLACTDDACRALVAKRLGARYVLTGAVVKSETAKQGDELRLAIVGDDGTRIAAIAIAGQGPSLIAQVPALVDALVGLATTPAPNSPVDGVLARVAPDALEPALFDPREPRWDAEAGAFYLP